MKLFHVHHRSPHHAQRSGYSRLSEFLNTQTVFGDAKVPYRAAKLFNTFHSENAGIYDTGSFLKETELFKLLLRYRKEPSVAHYLNAERDIKYLVKYKNFFPKASFCGTFHKPPMVLKRSIKMSTVLENLDGVIAVGTNQVEFLKDWLQIENVKFIPHGVDTFFFKPNLQKRKEKTLLFVGQHLRDFEVFNYCIPKIAEKINELKVNVVIHPAYRAKIKFHPSIKLHSNVQDAELLDFYHQASLMFLPLKEVTACNSILEGMACGLPIVTTNVGGNSFYLRGTKNIMVPLGDMDFYIEVIIRMLQDPTFLEKVGRSSRERAESLDWEVIAPVVDEFYYFIKSKNEKG